MTNEKELRDSWKEFNIDNLSLSMDEQTEIADWWLSKFHSHTKEVVEKIKAEREKYRKLELITKGTDLIIYFRIIEVLDDLLASLEDNKK